MSKNPMPMRSDEAQPSSGAGATPETSKRGPRRFKPRSPDALVGNDAVEAERWGIFFARGRQELWAAALECATVQIRLDKVRLAKQNHWAPKPFEPPPGDSPEERARNVEVRLVEHVEEFNRLMDLELTLDDRRRRLMRRLR
jgi:hypothetical protein